MTVPPLCILQARMGSHRLPGKVMLPLGGKPIVERCVERAREAFGAEHVIAAIPSVEGNEPLRAHLRSLGVPVVEGPEYDVLARFYLAAHRYRWTPDAVIVRLTCDDPFKEPALMRRVAAGERLPVELGAEAFTLAMLDAAHQAIPEHDERREHLTLALFDVAPPAGPTDRGVLTIDTQADYDAARRQVGDIAAPVRKTRKAS